MPTITRRTTVDVPVGDCMLGSRWPIAVQSMTNTDTADVESTGAQAAALAEAGSEMVRVTVNTPEAAEAVPAIRYWLEGRGIHVPLIGDFHYNGHLLLTRYPECAAVLSKYRINPGNVGAGSARDDNFARIIEAACEHRRAVRIGVNWGSLDQRMPARMMDENSRLPHPLPPSAVLRDALVRSALESARFAESCGLPHDRIVLSAKVSGVQELIDVYRSLAQACDYPLHLGLTEAGMGNRGVVSSAAAMAVLLQEGIGDTIRVSLTPAPGGNRSEEVQVARQILQSLGIRDFVPQVSACPGCGRTTSTFFQELAAQIEGYLRSQMPAWSKKFQGVEALRVAVMGCIVNGPGESKHSHIGISLPGTGEDPKAPVYADGRLLTTLKGGAIAADFIRLLNEYVESHYSPHP